MRKDNLIHVFRKTLILYVILPVFILESILFILLAGDQIKGVQNKLNSVQEQIVFNIHNELRDAKLLLATIAHNNYLIQTISDYASEKNNEVKLRYLFEIESNLDNLFNYHEKIDSISFYYKR